MSPSSEMRGGRGELKCLELLGRRAQPVAVMDFFPLPKILMVR